MKNLLLLTVLILASFSIQSQDMDDVKIITHKVTDNIYMLEGSGGNIGLSIGEDGILMIDDQYGELSEKHKKAINKLSSNSVKYLINTHWHGDHTGGNSNFAKDGTIIVAHDNVRERLSNDQIRPFGRTTKASPAEAWPQITFDKDISIHMNGENIHVIHVHAAHTDGDALVYFPKDNVLHMGDCLFSGMFPFIDVNSGGNIDGYIDAADAALMIVDNDTKIIPGHGPLSTKEDLENFKTMLETLRDRTKEAMSNGRDAESAKITRDYEEWSWGFITEEKIAQTFFSFYSDPDNNK